MPKKTMDVLVVGAGPVGLFCANELIRHGLRCRIIDKHQSLSDKSKALGLHIRTMDVMDDCGFSNAVLEKGVEIDGVVMNSNGKRVEYVLFADAHGNRPYAIDIPQDQTERVFCEGLQDKGCDVEWQTELTNVTQTTDGVTATVTKKNGKSETIHVPWLIACDGGHSTVRELLKIEFVGKDYKEDWWLADLHIDWGKLKVTRLMNIYLHKSGPLACFPMKDNRYRLVMGAPKHSTVENPTMEDITVLFNERSTDPAILSKPVWLSKFNLHHRQIQEYRKGRVFFAGDAAHVHSPLAGQGLNTGVQDAYNLAWKLALVHKQLAKESLLDSYHAERYVVGRDVLKKTDILTKAIQLKNPVLIFLRNTVLSLVSSIRFARSKLIANISQLAISYKGSPIVAQIGSSQRLKAGGFFSDFSLTDANNQHKVPLHTIVQGTAHHLFLFTGLNSSETRPLIEITKLINDKYTGQIMIHIIVGKKTAPIECNAKLWLDKAQAVHRQYAIHAPTAILFRPDKYIGLTQTPVEKTGLMHYLESIFMH